MSFLEDILRYIVVWIDKIIYPFIGVVYNLLLDIAETNVFTDEVIDVFASKVYALLGIFMLFKVSFSILTYIVNPDSFADKNKGFSKLISNVLITLALLLFTPWIFTQAMDIQRIILRDNIIGKIFSTSGNSTATISNSGQLMAYETFKAFYYLDVDNYPGCKGLDIGLDPTNASTCQSEAFNNSDEYSNHVDTLQFAENAKNVNIYLDFDLAVARDQSDKYTMSYLPVISSLAGIAIVLLLIVFCFDIAVRSIKLGFLRMIAPVPIISRIDPKKGTEVFNKWAKLCLNTYLDLFIRLIAIYFAVFVIGQLTELRIVDAVTGLEKDVSPFLFVFIVLGALLFAKQLPKLIEDLTGIKMDGKFTLNPLKKLGEVPVAGRPLESGARFLGRTGKTLGAGVGGFLAGKAASGVKSLDTKTGGHFQRFGNRVGSLRNSVSSHMPKEFAQIGADARKTFYGMTGGVLGGSKAADKFDEQIKEYDSIFGNIDAIMKKANSEMIKNESLSFTDSNGNSTNMRNFKVNKERLAALRNMDTSQMSSSQLDSHTATINDLQTYIAKSEKLAEQAFVDNVKSGTIKDAEISARLENVQKAISSSSDEVVRRIDVGSGKGLKDGKDAVSDAKIKTQQSAEYQRAQAKKAATPPKKNK